MVRLTPALVGWLAPAVGFRKLWFSQDIELYDLKKSKYSGALRRNISFIVAINDLFLDCNELRALFESTMHGLLSPLGAICCL